MTTAPDLQLGTEALSEWVGGIVTLPTSITEGGKTYRPSLIIWLDVATEMVLGTSVVPPRDGLATACANLRDTARSPKTGKPAMPGRVRVAAPELADALRHASLDDVEVVCAPTPELDRAIDSLLEHFGGDGNEADLTTSGPMSRPRAQRRCSAPPRGCTGRRPGTSSRPTTA